MTLLSDAPAREPAPPSRAFPRLSRTTAVLVGAVLLAGLVAYFWTRSDLWLDEALAVNIARLPLHQLDHALRHDGAPPLYYVLLHVWSAVLGSGDRAVRSLSGVCMVGTAVALWFGGRRIAGTAGAWIAVIVVASNPYAIRYATEARMYGLEMLLVSLGFLAFRRALESPTPGRLAQFGVLVALLMYTQYWALYLLIVVAVLLVAMLWRGRYRQPARRMFLTMAIAALAFIPWIPTFLYQRAHTGTPWGTAQLPGVPIGYTFRDFSGGDFGEGWLLLFPMIAMVLLGVFGRATGERRIEIDIRTQPDARWEALVGGATLVVGAVLAYLAGSAFEARYSAVMFPFFVLVVARGVTTLADPRVRGGVLAVMVVLGFGGAYRNITTNRTEAGQVAAILRADAHPGDLVVYCPDQLGPAVHRLAPAGLDEITYPRFGSPAFVDWVDYKARLARTSPIAFAHEALTRAGSRTVWLVISPGYITHGATCDTIAATFAARRNQRVILGSDPKLYEHPGLQEFTVRPGLRS